MKKEILATVFIVSLCIAAIVGEIRCVYKAFKCNWEPIGKAEVIYTAASLTGFGSVVGYLDIEDK